MKSSDQDIKDVFGILGISHAGDNIDSTPAQLIAHFRIVSTGPGDLVQLIQNNFYEDEDLRLIVQSVPALPKQKLKPIYEEIVIVIINITKKLISADALHKVYFAKLESEELRTLAEDIFRKLQKKIFS